MSTSNSDLDNLIRLARLAEHFMDAAVDRLPDPESDWPPKTRRCSALAEQASDELFAMDKAYNALLNREPKADDATLTAAATRLSHMTIRAGEAFARLAAQIVGDEKLTTLLADEDHNQADSDAFLANGAPLLARALAPTTPAALSPKDNKADTDVYIDLAREFLAAAYGDDFDPGMGNIYARMPDNEQAVAHALEQKATSLGYDWFKKRREHASNEELEALKHEGQKTFVQRMDLFAAAAVRQFGEQAARHVRADARTSENSAAFARLGAPTLARLFAPAPAL